MYQLTTRNSGVSLPTVQSIQSAVNRIFDEALSEFLAPSQQRGTSWSPAVDIYETATDLIFEVEVPGLDREAVTISIDNGHLTIGGQRTAVEEGRTHHRRERGYGKFERSFQLPASADTERVSARMDRGVLVITVPKREEARTRQIPVSIG